MQVHGEFIVAGEVCELQVDDACIRWRQKVRPQRQWRRITTTKCESSALSDISNNFSDKSTGISSNILSLEQIIGFKIKNDSQSRTRLKVYYAQAKANSTSGRLLKMKALNIIDDTTNTCAITTVINDSLAKNFEHGKAVNQTLLGVDTETKKRSSSDSPNSYTVSGGGSTGQLSSLSGCSGCYQAVDFSAITNTHLSIDDRVPATPAIQEPIKTSSDAGDSGVDLTSLAESAAASSSTVSTIQSIKSTASNGRGKLNHLAEHLRRVLDVIAKRDRRPQKLLIFVNPLGGKGRAVDVYKRKVRRLLDLARVESDIIVTKHANHARNTIEDPKFDVEMYDGVICVGGDGMFSELMNGLLFRYNRERILASELELSVRERVTHQRRLCSLSDDEDDDEDYKSAATEIAADECNNDDSETHTTIMTSSAPPSDTELRRLMSSLGGLGRAFVTPPLAVGMIGAGSTDANSFGFMGTNDARTATLNIILGKQINVDVCSVHTYERDTPLKFVSTFLGYGFFGDMLRESERLRWLGPSRYDVTGVNNFIKNRKYNGIVRVFHAPSRDGEPSETSRCHTGCECCLTQRQATIASPPPDHQCSNLDTVLRDDEDAFDELRVVEHRGTFMGVNAAVLACRCSKTKKGMSPSQHLANGCADLVLVRPCTRLQYLHFLARLSVLRKSIFDLSYVDAYRCRQFEFIADTKSATAIPSHQSFQRSKFVKHSKTTGELRNPAAGVPVRSNSLAISGRAHSLASLSSQRSISSKHSMDTLKKSKKSRQATSSWNVDGEILDEHSIRVKVNKRLLRVFGTGEPLQAA